MLKIFAYQPKWLPPKLLSLTQHQNGFSVIAQKSKVFSIILNKEIESISQPQKTSVSRKKITFMSSQKIYLNL